MDQFGNIIFEKINHQIVFIRDLNLENIHWNVNMVAINTQDDLIFIDSGFNPEMSKYVYGKIIRSFFKNTDGKPTSLILTHHHLDHSFGMHYFRQIGASIIAHKEFRNCIKDDGSYYINLSKRKILADHPIHLNLYDNVKISKPTIEFLGSYSLNSEIELHYTPGHTIDSLIVAHIPSDILITGDSLMPQPKGTLPMPQIDLDIHLKSIDLASELNHKLVLQGHGVKIEHSDIEFIRKQAIDLYGKI